MPVPPCDLSQSFDASLREGCGHGDELRCVFYVAPLRSIRAGRGLPRGYAVSHFSSLVGYFAGLRGLVAQAAERVGAAACPTLHP